MITGLMKNQQGAVTVTVLLAMVGMCGIAALAIDFATVQVARQQLQTAADAAALAGAGRLRVGADTVAARQTAQRVAENNSVLGDGATLNANADVTIGDYDPETQTVSSSWESDPLPVVQVTARRTAGSPDGPVPVSFARLFGINTIDVQATAVASVGNMKGFGGRVPIELIIIQDGSYSFRNEISFAKQADRSLVDLMCENVVDGDRVALVNFAASAWREANFGDMPDAQRSINNAIASGDYCNSAWDMIRYPSKWNGTHTGAGIDEAVEIFEQQGTDAGDQVIILVSDGMPYPEYRRPLAVAAADRAAARGIRIHIVTFDRDGGGEYGVSGSDAEFNASLVRNGGQAFHTPDKHQLKPLLEHVGSLEIGRPHLIR